jgi:hypothetical protein
VRNWSLILVGSVVSVLCIGVVWHRSFSGAETANTRERKTEPVGGSAPSSASDAAASPARRAALYFEDRCEILGIEFTSFSGTTPQRAFPTANGTGVAMLDYDQDGWLDLYFANACRLDPPTSGPPNALFRSQGGQSFLDATLFGSADATGFTQGVASADYDNDGFPDLYLGRFGANILLRNMGDGTFQDYTESSSTGDERWTTSAAFLDFDEDGSLDLYTANYGKWDIEWHNANFCGNANRHVRMYCAPRLLDPEVHGLFRSRGDGSFLDVAADLGIARTDGRGQGVVACDVNNDGHIDLYVANDLCPNFLFLNTGNGRFEDFSLISCAAYDSQGNSQAGMGVDATDVDGDGLPDLFVTNFFLEHNTLYKNLGDDLFQDISNAAGVAAASIQAVGWGTALEDLDGDGWLDIFVTNGHVDDNVRQAHDRDEPYEQLPGLWRNRGKGAFDHVVDDAGAYFRTPHVGRGAAFGDFDNDGDIDIVVAHKDQRPAVLANESRQNAETANAWIQLTLIGTRSNRDAIGSRVELELDSQKISRQIRGGKSYLSAHDVRLTIGLGQAPRVNRLTIHWPSQTINVLENVEVNRAYTIREPLDATGF